jgi:hypothetical protein
MPGANSSFLPRAGSASTRPTDAWRGANFVKLAVGRSFTDVPPNKGVFRGKASEAIQVRVQSEELAGVPPGLAPERFEALPVKIAGLPRAPHVDQIAQQQEQQQQEQQQQ